jgi:hypothetical protein
MAMNGDKRLEKPEVEAELSPANLLRQPLPGPGYQSDPAPSWELTYRDRTYQL